MRFLGLQLEDRVPDAKTVWLFRERLKELKLVEVPAPTQQTCRERKDQGGRNASRLASRIYAPNVPTKRRGCALGQEERRNPKKNPKFVRASNTSWAAQAQMGGHIVRTLGRLAAQVKIGMMNLVCNMVRLG